MANIAIEYQRLAFATASVSAIPNYRPTWRNMWWKPLLNQQTDNRGATPERVLGNKDVLVVEDEPYLCDLVADVLESEGHSARKASNGLEALERVGERIPDLILLDLMMPVMDGWEFLKALRSNPTWAPVPVVIITAVYDVARTRNETGAKAVITKPFDIDQLADVVRIYAS